MTDTAALIKRLRAWLWPDCPLPSEAVADMQEAAEALSRLTAPPPTLDDEAFDEAVRILTNPEGPTEANKRGAELLRRLYSKGGDVSGQTVSTSGSNKSDTRPLSATGAAPPPEEIAELIARLQPPWEHPAESLRREAAAALRSQAQHNADLIAEIGVRIHEASAANDLISSQAQEIEKLKAGYNLMEKQRLEINRQRDRIAELEDQLRIRTDREEWYQKNKYLFSESLQLHWLGAFRESDLMERIGQLEAERDEWKQCSEVEAGVRREFKELLERAEAERDAKNALAYKECARKAEEIADKFSRVDDPVSANACHLIAKDIRALAHKDEAKTH